MIQRIFFTYASWTAALLYILLLFFFSPNLELYDNAFLSLLLIWGDPGFHNTISSIFLLYPLSKIAALIPFWDPYTLFLFVWNGLSIVILARCLIQTKSTPNLAQILGWLLLVYLLLEPCLHLEFGTNSFLGMTAGLVLLIQATRKRSLWLSLAAIIFFSAAAGLRCDSCLGFIPIILLMSALEFYAGNRLLLRYALLVLAIILTINWGQRYYSSSVSMWGEEQVNLNTIHTARVSFADYPSFSSQEFEKKKIAQYDAIGFTETVRDSLQHYYFNTPLRKDREWWAQIYKIRKSHDFTSLQYLHYRLVITHRYFTNTLIDYAYYFLASSCCVLLFLIVQARRSNWKSSLKQNIPLLLCIALFYAFLLLLSYNMRMNDRSFIPAFLATHALGLFMARGYSSPLARPLALRSSLCLALVFSLLMMIVYRESLKDYYSPFSGKYQYPEITDSLESYFQDHPEQVFFAFTQEYRKTALRLNNFDASSMHRFDKRYFPMGDWESCFPFYENMLRSVGIDNDIDLLAHQNARFIFFGLMKYIDEKNFLLLLKHYNEYHHSNLELVEEYRYRYADKGNSGGYTIYRLEDRGAVSPAS